MRQGSLQASNVAQLDWGVNLSLQFLIGVVKPPKLLNYGF